MVLELQSAYCFKTTFVNNYFSDCLYSPEIEQLFKKKRIKAGDRVKITKGKHSYEGVLMPRIELGDPGSIVIKLNNGYNIGIRFGKGLKIRKLKIGRRIRFKPSKIQPTRDPNKPVVSILGCGGTIASRVEYTTGAVFPMFSPGDLLQSFPELKEVANIRGKKLFDLFSEDMRPLHWQIVARAIEKEVNEKVGGVDGVVLMHGTDTMHYTAAALSFMLQDLPIPVVIVGSQRSSDRGSSDNLMNLFSAVNAAANSDVAEVTVCMHANMGDDFCYLHQGTKLRKMHTSRRDAFRSINVLPYARVWYSGEKRGEIEYTRQDFRLRGMRQLKVDDKINPNVALIPTYPGIKPEFIDSLKDFDGVVIAGTGLGHVPTNPFGEEHARSIVPNLKNLIDSGIPVVIAPQTIFGRINMNVYTSGRMLNEIGIIGNGCDWTPECSLVKLMWVLGHTKNPSKVREMMLRNYAGEISDRTEVEGFF